ncbi:EEF1A lysine methyltransferase 2 [Pelomyxa schiedti]|nr:EEF1A lysine methyltransferase 2 [Pelomyxa schiedti]
MAAVPGVSNDNEATVETEGATVTEQETTEGEGGLEEECNCAEGAEGEEDGEGGGEGEPAAEVEEDGEGEGEGEEEEEEEDDCRLVKSKLGTKTYWDDTYSREIGNFDNTGDVGTVWFGSPVLAKVVTCVVSLPGITKSSSVLDIGTGNGLTLITLAAKYGFTSLVGSDFSEPAVQLATKISAKRGLDIKFIVDDVTHSIIDHKFQLVIDKGTFDAIALTQQTEREEKKEQYRRAIVSFLQPPPAISYFVITSCNFTTAELREFFGPVLHYHSQLEYPVFTFGGKQGSEIGADLTARAQFHQFDRSPAPKTTRRGMFNIFGTTTREVGLCGTLDVPHVCNVAVAVSPLTGVETVAFATRAHNGVGQLIGGTRVHVECRFVGGDVQGQKGGWSRKVVPPKPAVLNANATCVALVDDGTRLVHDAGRTPPTLLVSDILALDKNPRMIPRFEIPHPGASFVSACKFIQSSSLITLSNGRDSSLLNIWRVPRSTPAPRPINSEHSHLMTPPPPQSLSLIESVPCAPSPAFVDTLNSFAAIASEAGGVSLWDITRNAQITTVDVPAAVCCRFIAPSMLVACGPKETSVHDLRIPELSPSSIQPPYSSPSSTSTTTTTSTTTSAALPAINASSALTSRVALFRHNHSCTCYCCMPLGDGPIIMTGCSVGMLLFDLRRPDQVQYLCSTMPHLRCCDAYGPLTVACGEAHVKTYHTKSLISLGLESLSDPSPRVDLFSPISFSHIDVWLPGNWARKQFDVNLLSTEIQLRKDNQIIDIIHLTDINMAASRDASRERLVLFTNFGVKYELAVPPSPFLDTLENYISEMPRAALGNHLREEDFVMESNPFEQGSYGNVFVGRRKRSVDNMRYAIKRLKKPFVCMSPKDKEDFMREVSALAHTHHQFVLNALGFYQTSDGYLCLVTEYIGGGDLTRYLYDPAKYPMNTQQVFKLAYNFSLGMEYIHQINLMHRDLKPANILVQSWASFSIKIADFGLARMADSNNLSFTAHVGTHAYTAPEIDASGEYDKSIDIFAFGIILWEMVTRKRPWIYEYRPAEVVYLKSLGKRPTIPPDTNPKLASLIERCWHQNVESRPAFTDIVRELTEACPNVAALFCTSNPLTATRGPNAIFSSVQSAAIMSTTPLSSSSHLHANSQLPFASLSPNPVKTQAPPITPAVPPPDSHVTAKSPEIISPKGDRQSDPTFRSSSTAATPASRLYATTGEPVCKKCGARIPPAGECACDPPLF